MIDLNAPLKDLAEQQHIVITGLVGFLYKIASNERGVNQKDLLDTLLDGKLHTLIDTNSPRPLFIAKIKELESEMYKRSKMIDNLRDIINNPEQIENLDKEGFNKMIDEYVCEWAEN